MQIAAIGTFPSVVFPAQATKLFLRSVAVGSKTSLNKLGAKCQVVLFVVFFVRFPFGDGNLFAVLFGGLKKNS